MGGRGLGKTLEIGAGCGYQAAVLAQLSKDVYAVERIAPLLEKAKANMRTLQQFNVRLKHADGRFGLPEAGPFDSIIVAAAGAGIPPDLLRQLAPAAVWSCLWGGKSSIFVLSNIHQTVSRKRDWTRLGLFPCYLEHNDQSFLLLFLLLFLAACTQAPAPTVDRSPTAQARAVAGEANIWSSVAIRFTELPGRTGWITGSWRRSIILITRRHCVKGRFCAASCLRSGRGAVGAPAAMPIGVGSGVECVR
jgi:SAM-dependent methyltransferase